MTRVAGTEDKSGDTYKAQRYFNFSIILNLLLGFYPAYIGFGLGGITTSTGMGSLMKQILVSGIAYAIFLTPAFILSIVNWVTNKPRRLLTGIMLTTTSLLMAIYFINFLILFFFPRLVEGL